MNPVYMALGVALPILGIFFRPTRLIGKGGPWVLLGAAMLVGSMMLLFLSVKDIGQPGGDEDTAGLDAADVSALVGALQK